MLVSSSWVCQRVMFWRAPQPVCKVDVVFTTQTIPHPCTHAWTTSVPKTIARRRCGQTNGRMSSDVPTSRWPHMWHLQRVPHHEVARLVVRSLAVGPRARGALRRRVPLPSQAC